VRQLRDQARTDRLALEQAHADQIGQIRHDAEERISALRAPTAPARPRVPIRRATGAVQPIRRRSSGR
jgi:hypothetical protein